MKRKTIKFCALILVVALCVPLLLSGCGEKTLWVVSDARAGSRRDKQITSLVNSFQTSHPGLTVKYERIPLKQESREVALERIRTATMAGKGPDVFLLTTYLEDEVQFQFGNRYDSYVNYEVDYQSAESALFPDVQQAMQNGMFMDISKYYDADEELNKEELVPAVMEAGVYRNKRFVLPLRFDLPVAYVDVEQFEAAGFSMDVFDEGYLGLMKAVVASGDTKMAADSSVFNISRISLYNFCPNLLDYENQEVLLTADELAELATTHYQMYDLQGKTKRTASWGLTGYFARNMGKWHWSDEAALTIGRVDKVVADAAIAKAKNIDLAIVPLTAPDGTLIADVTLYGAIGKGCNNPKLAYEFLRKFLSEDIQWENTNLSAKFETETMPGWPVRTVGAVEQMFQNQCSYYQNAEKLMPTKGMYLVKGLENCVPCDDDIPNWHEEIDVARFALSTENKHAERVWYGMWDLETLQQIKLDPSVIAGKIIEDLEWHLAEG